jgi:hypothetical protein
MVSDPATAGAEAAVGAAGREVYVAMLARTGLVFHVGAGLLALDVGLSAADLDARLGAEQGSMAIVPSHELCTADQAVSHPAATGKENLASLPSLDLPRAEDAVSLVGHRFPSAIKFRCDVGPCLLDHAPGAMALFIGPQGRGGHIMAPGKPDVVECEFSHM